MSLSSFSMKVLSASLVLAATTGLVSARTTHATCYKGEVVAPRAAPCCCAPTPCCYLKDGFYLGGQLGYDAYSVRKSYSIPALGFAGNHTLSGTGWVGGLFLGYGRYLGDMYYLGGEILGNYSNADAAWNVTFPGGSYRHTWDARGTYGLAILPGIKLNCSTLGYLRLGWNWARFKTQESIPGTQFNHTKNSNGFNYGLGVETLLMDNWSVRTEYSYTRYKSYNTDFVTKVRPSDHQFMLGLNYHFC